GPRRSTQSAPAATRSWKDCRARERSTVWSDRHWRRRSRWRQAGEGVYAIRSSLRPVFLRRFFDVPRLQRPFHMPAKFVAHGRENLLAETVRDARTEARKKGRC